MAENIAVLTEQNTTDGHTGMTTSNSLSECNSGVANISASVKISSLSHTVLYYTLPN